MELKEAGLAVGERRIGRLMRLNGIKPVRTRRHKVTTDSNHRLGVAANWLDGDFVAAAPNQKWAGDITYIWTQEGWLYLAVILDLHSRRVVGWAVSDRMKKDLAIRALDMAVRLRNPPPGCIFHSDRGSQYCSYAYQKKLQAYGLRPSMSGKGNCYDNSAVETFFKSLKAELIWRQKWPTRRQAEAAIFQYINGSTTPAGAIHIWAALARSHSKPRWHSEIGDRRKTVTSPPVVDAAIVHIVRTPSALALISLEDLIGEEEQPNLPGTTTEHPNWRRRIATPLDELLADKRVQQCCNTLNRRRPNPVV